MAHGNFIAGSIAAIALLLGSCADLKSAPEKSEPQAPASFAVVELFTSEGCSSCPPADDLLAKLIDEAREKGRPVFALAFHVDYWNRMGWVDKLSDAAHSRRQEKYQKALSVKYLYTPQMIVNGTDQFLGSDREAADKAIATALGRNAAGWVAITVEKAGDDEIQIHFSTRAAPAGAVLNVAVVENGLETKVGHGENAGHTLRHASVVRVFNTISIPESGNGDISLKVPQKVIRANASIIAFVQDPKGMSIHAAAGAKLP